MTDHYKFENTPLPYGYDALEPYIDSQTMQLHHDKHLQTYIDNLNNALKDYPRLQTLTLGELILSAPRLPKAIGTPIARNAGGVYNHRFYFEGIEPPAEQSMNGALEVILDKTFGGYDAFREKFKVAALAVFGSGYAWLVTDRQGRLSIITTANQETPLTRGMCPVLNIDVWEHAYYLKHYNKRTDYIDDWFHVINWSAANSRYLACINY